MSKGAGALRECRTFRFVEDRICALLTHPDAWGAPEAVELQVLLVLEVGLTASGAPDAVVGGLQDRYNRHLAREVGGLPTSLALRLGLDRTASQRLVQVLAQFCQSENLPWDGACLAEISQLSR
jgi:hypothetical protein